MEESYNDFLKYLLHIALPEKPTGAWKYGACLLWNKINNDTPNVLLSCDIVQVFYTEQKNPF